MPLQVINLRISDDLRAAVYQAAEQQGVTASEWIRALIFQAVYGEPPGADQGYMQGKALGYMIVTRGMQELSKGIPATPEEANAWLRAHDYKHDDQ